MKWRFHLKAAAGLLVITFSCFLAIGLAVGTEEGGERVPAQLSVWWAFTIAFAVSMVGLLLIVRAARRSGSSPKWIGYFLFGFAGLLAFAAWGMWLEHDRQGTQIMALIAVLLAPSGWFLIRIAPAIVPVRISVPFPPQVDGPTGAAGAGARPAVSAPSPPAPEPLPAPVAPPPKLRHPSLTSRVPVEFRGPVSKLLLFMVVIAIDVGVAYVPVIPAGSKATVFTTILVLGCVASGIVSEKTAAKVMKLGKN